MEAFLEYMTEAWGIFKQVLEYKPLWVVMIIVSVTQIGKMVMGALMQNDVVHRLITRGVSALAGVLGGYFILSADGDHVSGAMFGLALAIAISIIYVPVIKWLRSKEDSPFCQSLANWLSGK